MTYPHLTLLAKSSVFLLTLQIPIAHAATDATGVSDAYKLLTGDDISLNGSQVREVIQNPGELWTDTKTVAEWTWGGAKQLWNGATHWGGGGW